MLDSFTLSNPRNSQTRRKASCNQADLFVVGLIALAFLACGNNTHAKEVKSECPLISPSDGRTPLGFDVVLPYGDAADGARDPDQVKTFSNMRHIVYEFEAYRLPNTRIECAYGVVGRPWVSKSYVDIPGLLVRCESTFRIPAGRQRHPDDRYWCISRVDD